MKAEKYKKLLVIGIDGATWDLIEPWISEGKLPTFKKLYENGVHGILMSTIPPLTPPAWTSAFTGVNPGKHGIYDFFHIDGYSKKLINSSYRKAKAIWKIKNKKWIIINIPQTYPPEEINGIMISGMGTPDLTSNFTYPSIIKDKLILKKYIIDYEDILDLVMDKEAYSKKIYEMIEKRTEVSVELMKNYEWDIFVIVFVATDRVQHFFWKYMDENDKKLGSVIYNTYLKIDEAINKFLRNIDENTYIIIFSDHGFGPLYYDVYMNNYLQQLGILKLNKNKRNVLYKILNTKNLIKIGTLMSKIGFSSLVRWSYIKLKKNFINLDLKNIDWSHTKAWFYSLSGQSIRINLKGREPQGIVDESEYDDLINKITEKLLSLKHNSKKLIKKVYRANEIYKGSYIENAPDLIVTAEEGYTLQEGFGDEIILPAKQGPAERSGDHRPEGMFLSYGPSIKRGYRIKGARIYDIAPTILHILGLPIPNDMDGKVLTEIFEEHSEFAKRKPSYVDSNYYEKKDEREKIKEKIDKLKKLGKI